MYLSMYIRDVRLCNCIKAANLCESDQGEHCFQEESLQILCLVCDSMVEWLNTQLRSTFHYEQEGLQLL